MNGPAFAALALWLEGLTGYPDAIYRKIGHPIEWIGWVIFQLDQTLNVRGTAKYVGRLRGVAAVTLLCVGIALPAAAFQYLTHIMPGGWLLNIALAIPFLAQKSLRDHTTAVADALGTSLDLAREEVSKIVGRDPSCLDESGISKAALESLAENTSDGIVAPALWYAIAGLPGLWIYKAINTADSMIGHKSEKYLHFGWAAARLDDLVNLPASRLTSLLFCAAAWITSANNATAALSAVWRDASKHNSPNAGWPEAAMAGALELRLGGPRTYDTEVVELPWMGDGRDTISRTDIAAGVQLYDRALMILAVMFLLLAFLLR